MAETEIDTVLAAEVETEEGETLRMLGRVPADQWEWRPHDKSMPLGQLAGHLATLPSMVRTIMLTERFDIMHPQAGFTRPRVPTSAAELVAAAQECFGQARLAISRARDADLFTPWTFAVGPRESTAPRIVALRTYVLSHVVHHRAQLGVYFRLCGVPVPGLYGMPSADETWDA